MIKRAIGIDLGSSYLRAVQLVRDERQLRMEKIFTIQVRRSTDSLADAITSLVSRHGFDQKAPIAVSVPQDAVFFRNIETDNSEFRGDHSFPIPAGEIVTQTYPPTGSGTRRLPDGRFSILAVAAKKQALQQKCELLAQAELVPVLADAAIFAIHSAVAFNYPEVSTGSAAIAYLDESYLTVAVIQDSTILIVRNLRLAPDPVGGRSETDLISSEQQPAEILAREVAVSWRKVFQTEIAHDSRIYLVSQKIISGEFEAAITEKLPCRIIFFDPYANVKPISEGQAAPDLIGGICLAEGLALRILSPEKAAGVNFLQAAGGDSRPELNLRRELKICSAMVGAIVLLLLTGVWVRAFYMVKENRKLENEIKQVFQAALPEEKNIMDPLTQLDPKIQSVRKEYRYFVSFNPTGRAALDVLLQLSESMPSKGGFKVDDLFVTPDSVSISGSCNSFASMYEWQEILKKIPGFATVDVYPREKLESGAVSFTISVGLKFKN